MKKTSMHFLMLLTLLLTSCQKNKPTEEAKIIQHTIPAIEKIGEQSALCLRDLCVDEKELYQKRGPQIYAIDDQLYYQKNEMAKNLLIQKLVEKKSLKAGERFSDHHRKTKTSIKVDDQEVISFLAELEIKEIEKNSSDFSELKNRILNQKIQNRYIQEISPDKKQVEIYSQIPRIERPTVKFNYQELLTYHNSSKDLMKVIIIFNPASRELKNITQITKSLSRYFEKKGIKIGWYFLPTADSKGWQSSYQKLLICSTEIDHGDSFRIALDVSRNFDNENQILEFLSSKSKNTNSIKECLNNPKTQAKSDSLNKTFVQTGLPNMTQIAFDDQIEAQIPGMIDLLERIQIKLSSN